jgi:tetraprenyl-beta-curcumene synthase
MLELFTLENYVINIFPKVKKELKQWQVEASFCPSPFLQEQAIKSIEKKTFHCLGGSIYCLHPEATEELLPFIVAFQTISDYLDNLCDFAPKKDANAFRQLHLALRDAVLPYSDPTDYYAYYPEKEDGGYLNKLVKTCQSYFLSLPSYTMSVEKLVFLVDVYSELQTLKHLETDKREEELKKWVKPFQNIYCQLEWQEFSASTGSTLGVFMLAILCSKEKLSIEELNAHFKAYFPWMQGFHILLDYLIDLEEDTQEGALNFVAYYESERAALEGLEKFFLKAKEKVSILPHKDFHRLVINGLLAMYLSDEKTEIPSIQFIARKLVKIGGLKPTFYHNTCKLLRQLKVL